MTNEQAAQAYRERIEGTEKVRGFKAAVDRGTAMICSWTLGREFGETCDSYFARNPEKQLFINWFREYRERVA